MPPVPERVQIHESQATKNYWGTRESLEEKLKQIPHTTSKTPPKTAIFSSHSCSKECVKNQKKQDTCHAWLMFADKFCKFLILERDNMETYSILSKERNNSRENLYKSLSKSNLWSVLLSKYPIRNVKITSETGRWLTEYVSLRKLLQTIQHTLRVGEDSKREMTRISGIHATIITAFTYYHWHTVINRPAH